jgi:hypothetical protein
LSKDSVFVTSGLDFSLALALCALRLSLSQENRVASHSKYHQARYRN